MEVSGPQLLSIRSGCLTALDFPTTSGILALPEVLPVATDSHSMDKPMDAVVPPETPPLVDSPLEGKVDCTPPPLPGPINLTSCCVDCQPVPAYADLYRQAWSELMSDQWILDILTSGDALEFWGRCPPPIMQLMPPEVCISTNGRGPS